MKLNIPSNRIPFLLEVCISADSPVSIMAVANDSMKDNTCYLSRQGVLDTWNNAKGKYYQKYYLRFPTAPQSVNLDIFNPQVGNVPSGVDSSFTIESINSKSVETKPQWMDKDLAEFFPFCNWFCDNAGIFSASLNNNGQEEPSIYRSRNSNFRIDYLDILFEDDGSISATPARVGHKTGRIEVSAAHFRNYTVPVRRIILLHEYCHKYVNPKINRKIEDEGSADLNAVNIALCFGDSPVEILQGYLEIFSGANNASNERRYKNIVDFINKWNNGQYKQPNYVA